LAARCLRSQSRAFPVINSTSRWDSAMPES
jgi:hypothetical protein